ncbi:MAG: FAD-binding oxidoreductase [Alphaproteobacteria bacterium]
MTARPTMRKTTNVELLNRLRDVLGGRRVSRSELDRVNYARDLWPRSLLGVRRGEVPPPPDLIVWPETTEEVSRVMKICNDMQVPVVPFGAGSGLTGAAQPLCGGVILDTKRMNRLERISEKSLIAVCQTGIIGALLEKELNHRGYTMGHYPGSMYTSTLGGYLATRSAGQAATLYGKIEDIVISMQAVLADGTVMHTRTAPRRATGPDFNHVFLGSEGSLAVLTRAHMRIHLLPQARAFRSLVFKNVTNGLEAMRQIMRLGLRPAIARFSDEADTGTTMNALGLSVKGCLLVLVFDGWESQVELESQKALEICRAEGGRDHGEEPAQQWFAHRFAEFYRQSPIYSEQKMLLDTIEVAATWSKAMPVYEAVHQALDGVITVLTNFSHIYPEGCSLAFTVLGQAENEDDFQLYDDVWRRALEATLQAGGVISHAHGLGRLKIDWLGKQNPTALSLLRGLKRRLDPNNVLNPGKLAPNPEGAC